ncbi:unnamed protein product [Albugo candida]|uniref:Uncharacterized protein n=1 Tax=Albugo candida TaxID=65357 RepID=A0A024G083_9STRA|nr:unnamed protein product [Albugo candida]|eukprot:CCI40178.1 unnamed protein product [Albugo candida]
MLTGVVMLAFGLLAEASAANETSTCKPVDYTAQWANVHDLNGLLIITDSILPLIMAHLDPFIVQDYVAQTFRVRWLGANFTVTPKIRDLEVKGLSRIILQELKVRGSDRLALALSVDGPLEATGSFTFRIAEINRKWYHPCWTDFFHQILCRPADVDVQVKLQASSVQLTLQFLLRLLQCSSGNATCQNLAIEELVNLNSTSTSNSRRKRILNRIDAAFAHDVSITFEQLKSFEYQVVNQSRILKILNTMIPLGKNRMAQHTALCRFVSDIVGETLEDAANYMIQKYLYPLFGHTCFDK